MDEHTGGVDAYLADLPEERRDALTQLRSLVRCLAPEASESMRYRMPTYELPGGMLCAFASQKRYMSLYVETDLVEAYREALGDLDVGKSCIRFRRLEQLPLATIEAILRETAVRRAAPPRDEP